MDFGSQLKIVSWIDKRTNINGETTKTNWHLLQDSDNMIHVDRPLEVESITSIDINPGTWKCWNNSLDTMGEINLKGELK